MNKIQMSQTLLILGVFAFAMGCNPATDSADKSDASPQSHGPDEHVHADGTVHKNHSVEGHAHAPGPHGGTIVDWGGGKFHVEFTVDHDNQEATVYVFGTDEKTSTPIDATEIILTIKEPSLTTKLKPSPQEGDPNGKASRFVGNHEGLGVVREYEGSLSGLVDGTPYSGNFKEESHDH